MREILFRGKRIATYKWIEGSLLDYGDGDFDICAPSDEPNDLFKYCVDPNTVGQYTGLKDKNGKKIFEGDIVVVELEDSTGEHWRETKKVHYNSAECCWYPMRWEDECDLCDAWTEIRSIEVIGNIHDNLELLGGADND